MVHFFRFEITITPSQKYMTNISQPFSTKFPYPTIATSIQRNQTLKLSPKNQNLDLLCEVYKVSFNLVEQQIHYESIPLLIVIVQIFHGQRALQFSYPLNNLQAQLVSTNCILKNSDLQLVYQLFRVVAFKRRLPIFC